MIELQCAQHSAAEFAQAVQREKPVCADCLAEMRDPRDRRFGYAFTNCTNCGPRYTITRQIPYDRANTTMADFRMCSDCEAEYRDPGDRRFHAEHTACQACGPTLSDRIEQVVDALRRDEIVAVKRHRRISTFVQCVFGSGLRSATRTQTKKPQAVRADDA